MRYFTTYLDKNYLSRLLSLIHSLNEQKADYHIFVLALDEFVYDFLSQNYTKETTPMRLDDLENFDQELLAVKNTRKKIEYYFTLTPCLPLFVLHQFAQVDMITYIDSDIYFFDSPEKIFQKIGDASVVVVSHHFSAKNKHLERFGKYNVVFNTFRRDEDGLKCLTWWRESCLAWCFDFYEDGKYADQKYLDEFENLSNKVYVIDAKSINLAGFNVDGAALSLHNGRVYVDDEALIFYHFHRLKKFQDHFFDMYPHAHWDENIIYSPIIQKIYTVYIRSMQFYEKKYQLQFENSTRYGNHAKSLLDLCIFDYPLYVNSFVSFVVHLKKYYEFYTKIKSLFSGKTH